MKIITVIPLTRGIFKENLTYFSASDAPVGAVVVVPVRKKKMDALVIKSENLISTKSLVKKSAFSLKKIGEIKGISVLPENLLRAAFKLRNYAVTNSGIILAAVLPKIFLLNYQKLQRPDLVWVDKKNLKQEKLILQNSLPERLSYYKTFIRESFARQKSVFITLPTIRDAEFFRKNLSKGVENYVFVFHNEIPQKEFREKFNALAITNHPVLVIATPSYLFLINNKFGAVIVEHESANAYKIPGRPYLDMRTWAEILTAEYNIKLILADTLLRVETLWRKDNYELTEAAPISFRLSDAIKKELIDMKIKKKFSVLSDNLHKAIKDALKLRKKTFLFCARKGLGNVTVCNDCNSSILCQSCAKPLVLYGEKNRVFMCHYCKKEIPAIIKCNICQSWNLKVLGIGIDLVYEEVKKEFPNAMIFRIDKKNSQNAKEGKRIMEEFYKIPGAILIGTDMAIYYIKDKIENIAVVSFDSLFTIPDFRMNEKIMHLLVELEEYTKESFLIQTRNPQEEVLQQYFLGNLGQFVRGELKVREELHYPPFGVLIKIVYKGPKKNMEKAAEYLENIFRQYNPSIFRAFVPKIKNLYVLNVVLKIKRNNWTLPEISSGSLDDKLLAKLISLPPALSVEVDPASLL